MKPEAIDIATARNIAKHAAGYGPEIGIGRAEWGMDGYVATPEQVAERIARFAAHGIAFTPDDVCMVYATQVHVGECFTIPGARRQAALNRPWMILIWDHEAKDKRGRVRRWASSQAALREARKIEREILGIPKRKRVGVKNTPPAAGPLLNLMEGHQ